MDTRLPDKQYMKIGEVSRFTSLNSSVLRFWETEFPQLRPTKSRAGQRLYSRENLELILNIRQLLYHEKLTIAGARTRIAKQSDAGRSLLPEDAGSDEKDILFDEIRQELRTLRDLLG